MTAGSRRVGYRRLATIALLCLPLGCATHGERFHAADHALARHGPEAALAHLEARPSARQSALDLLEEGMLLHMTGAFERSNERLDAAARRMDALDPFSVSEGIAAVTVSEASGGFVGQPFERVGLHVVRAFNFIAQGQWHAARVEALQIDLRLDALAQSGNTLYGDDGLARYVAGMIFEQLGEYDDALIAYRKALTAYREQQSITRVAPPQVLQSALLRMTAVLDRSAEHERLLADFDLAPERVRAATQRRHGRILLILGNGRVPRIEEVAVHAQHPESGKLHRVAVPRYGSPREPLAGVRLHTAAASAEAEAAQRYTALAQRSLEERMPGIMARAAVRVAAKNRIMNEAREKDPFLGLLANLFTFATERADDRAWSTMPGEILIAELALEPGTHRVHVELRGHGGRSWREEIGEIAVQPGRTQVLFARSLSEHIPFHMPSGESP